MSVFCEGVNANRAAGARGFEYGPGVELEHVLERRCDVVVEERCRIGGLDDRRGVECAVAEAAVRVCRRLSEPAVDREVLDAASGMHHVLDVGVEVAVLAVREKGAGIVMTRDTAAARDLRLAATVYEQRLAILNAHVEEGERGKVEVGVAAERQLEGLHRVELVLVRKEEVNPSPARQAPREVLRHRADRKVAQ